VPLPPLDLQKKFAGLVKSIELLRGEMLSKLDAFSELQSLVTQQALLGDLTASWREQNQDEIVDAAISRDALLRERGAKLAKPTTEQKPTQAQTVDSECPARHWLLGELSEFQRQVLAAFKAYCEQNDQQPLLAEDPDEFTRFCDDDEVTERLQFFGSALNNRIRRTLSQLAALGLIAKVTLPKQNLETKEREYLKAFRLLRETEYTRLADVAILRKVLSPGKASYYFTVGVDYETSEHAGAGGMFQVTELRDNNDKDCTHLVVDRGKHYSDLNELAYDIAERLGVNVDQVELEQV
jgi:type I restriction enzyme S subunit